MPNLATGLGWKYWQNWVNLTRNVFLIEHKMLLTLTKAMESCYFYQISPGWLIHPELGGQESLQSTTEGAQYAFGTKEANRSFYCFRGGGRGFISLLVSPLGQIDYFMLCQPLSHDLWQNVLVYYITIYVNCTQCTPILYKYSYQHILYIYDIRTISLLFM